MGESVETIIALVFLAIFALVRDNKKKKKYAAAKSKEPQPKPAAPKAPPKPVNESFEKAMAALSDLLETEKALPDPDKPAPVKPAPVKVRQQTSIEAETAMKKRDNLIRQRVHASVSGESVQDEHGCIGGSMPDHEAEGESRDEHAAHEKKRAERLKAESQTASRENPGKPSVSDLRKAVVMAEILDKPVSLRRRRI